MPPARPNFAKLAVDTDQIIPLLFQQSERPSKRQMILNLRAAERNPPPALHWWQDEAPVCPRGVSHGQPCPSQQYALRGRCRGWKRLLVVCLRPEQEPALLRWLTQSRRRVHTREIHCGEKRHGLLLWMQGQRQQAALRRNAQATPLTTKTPGIPAPWRAHEWANRWPFPNSQNINQFLALVGVSIYEG